jgi:hypothetical protein
VARFRLCFATIVAVAALLAVLLPAQVADEDETPPPKPASKTHKESPSPTASPKKKSAAKPSKTASPKAKASPKKTPTPKPGGSAAKKKKTPSPSSEDEEQATPRPKPSSKPTSSVTAKSKSAKKKPSSKKKTTKEKTAGSEKKTQPAKTPTPAEVKALPGSETAGARAPRGVAVPSPSEHPTPILGTSPSDTAAQLTIEKSGLEESHALEPPPSPPPRKFWFWPWSRSRSSSQRYSYLTRSVIEEIRRAPVVSNRWKFIVVHNSGTRQGNARVFDYYHRRVRRMKNGLAYHFVIGNGTSTGNGEIEIGDRWRRQINGGHVHSDYLNNIALGICLVGDFNRDQPTRAQLDSCEELIRYLRERCGKADGRAIPVRPHREVNPPRWATDCPGDAFPYSWFRKF